MGFFEILLPGLALLGQPSVLLAILVGVTWGTFGGSAPGVSSTLALAVMVPFTFTMDPIPGIALLLGIAVGTSFGNAVPAILVGIPGSPAAVFTAIDGFELQKQGRTGLALGIALVASVLGQGLSALLFIGMIVPLAMLVYEFHAPELFALHLLGMTAIASVAGRNILKGLVAVGIGLALTMVGQDPGTGLPRFDFGIVELRGGLEIIPVVIGFLAVSELFRGFRQLISWQDHVPSHDTSFPSWREWRRAVPGTLTGAIIGTVMGAIPGVGSAASAAASYQQARMWSRRPEDFGRGSIDGLSASESAQNASQSGEMVPTLGFGIPGSATMVLLLAALTMHGISPGPLLIETNPEMVHATVAGFLGAVVLLSIVGWWAAKALTKVVLIDRSLILVCAFALSMLGSYAIRQSLFDVYVMLACGLVGYFMGRYGYPVAATAIAAVLGGGLEAHFRRGMALVDSELTTFVTRPITMTVLIICAVFLAYGIWSTVKVVRAERAAETDPVETP